MADGSTIGTVNPVITLELFPTYTGITAKCLITAFDPTLNYGVDISCCKAGNQNDKTHKIFNVRRPMKTEISLEHTFNELIPNTPYMISVKMLNTSGRPSAPTGSIIASKYLVVHTRAISGTFKVTNRSASVVAVELSDLIPLEYATTVKLSYKREEDTEWRLSTTKSVEANTTQVIAHMFTGLMADTTYDIKAEIFKGEELVKAFKLTAITRYYDPAWSDIIPSVDSYLAVPNTGKAFVKVKLSKQPNWEEGEVGLHLFRYDGYDYVERFEFLDIFDDDIVGFVTETAGSEKQYKVGFISAHDSSDIFNLTEPFTISYPQYTWADKVAGQPLIVSAEDVWNMADSLIRAHEYQVAVVKYHEYDYDHERRQSALDSLKGLMSGIRVGGEITADIINAVDLLAITFLETDSTAINSRLNAIKEAQGEVIDAVDINDMKSLVTNALATI